MAVFGGIECLSNISAKISMMHLGGTEILFLSLGVDFSRNNPSCNMFSCIWKSQAQWVSIKVIH
jgi:hypothetical protein